LLAQHRLSEQRPSSLNLSDRACVLIAFTVAVVVALTLWTRIAVGVVGSWIVASGLLMIGLNLRRMP
jgi:type IV secretory pathway TrbD component